jgi:diguanylate cyclase (GGDEF)-like protein
MKTSGPFAYLGRYGGDEFLAVLPNTTPFHAAEFAELLRSVVASKQFTCGAEHVSLTVSIGVTTSTTFRETTEELIASADNALYVAKLKGTTTLSDKEDLRVKKPVVSADRIRRGPLDDLSM